ncbi:MAG: hypothetical protein AABX62_01655, partial [Thermoproteota archaeon]
RHCTESILFSFLLSLSLVNLPLNCADEPLSTTGREEPTRAETILVPSQKRGGPSIKLFKELSRRNHSRSSTNWLL